jgi:hypothetical protein
MLLSDTAIGNVKADTGASAGIWQQVTIERIGC